MFVCVHTYTHTKKVCIWNYFCGDNFLIVSVAFVGDNLSLYGFQKLHIEAVITTFINCYFWDFCNALKNTELY